MTERFTTTRFAMVPFWLVKKAQLGEVRATSVVVYLTLMVYANSDRRCWPAKDALIETSGVSHMTFRHALRELERVGAVVIDRREGHSNIYTMPLDDRGVLEDSQGGVLEVSPQTITSELEPIKELNTPLPQGELLVPAQRAPAGDFKAFWAVAVRKAAIANARAAYAKAIKKVTPEVIQVTWERHNRIWATWPKDTRTYIPYPASWLNQECWHNDDPEFRGGGMVADALANMTDEEAHLAMFGAFRHNGHSQTQAFPAITDSGDTTSHPEGR